MQKQEAVDFNNLNTTAVSYNDNQFQINASSNNIDQGNQPSFDTVGGQSNARLGASGALAYGFGGYRNKQA
jgi:hypothetical protein